MTSTSDEKRREVVRELRGLDVFTDPIDGAELYDSGEVETALGFEYEDCGWYYASGVDAVADLIDRPTCHLVGTTSEEGLYGPTIFRHELSCGHTCDTGWEEPPSFCPVCGAMVVEKEEDDG